MKTQTPIKLMLVPPRIVEMMSGVKYAELEGDICILTYTDGSKESAPTTANQWNDAGDNFFSLVSHVQSFRK